MMIRHTHGTDCMTYGVLCVSCKETHWEYETCVQATEARTAHIRDTGCRGSLVDVVSTDVDLLGRNDERHIIDPNDPPRDRHFTPENFDVPDGLGYRLEGTLATRTLIGPCGTELAGPSTAITVVGPGTAIVREGISDKTVRWQPDLRELDAWERLPNSTNGYLSDAEQPSNDYRSEKVCH